MIRRAVANWRGSGKSGEGNLSTQSNTLDRNQYSFDSRFENGEGTNPEELIAAAHAGCFTMKLSVLLQEEDYATIELETDCEVTLDGGTISNSDLKLTASVEGISEDKFAELVENAKTNCPVSQALNTQISVDYKLNN